MKKTFFSLLMVLWASIALAQGVVPRPGGGSAEVSFGSTTGSGSLTANGQSASITLAGYGAVSVLVTGTWTGTLTFEVSTDGTTYQSVEALPSNSSTAVLTTTANGTWSASAGGFHSFRVRATAAMTGTAVVSLRASLAEARKPAGTLTVNDVGVTSFPDNEPFNLAQLGGSAPSATNPLFTRPTDGSSALTWHQADADTGAGTANRIFAGIFGTASGGASLISATGTSLNVNFTNSSLAATQSGTWTVQPGNTANTTPWLTTISEGGNAATVNASGQLAVNCANCSGSGVSHQDNAAFTFGTTNMVPIGGVFDDTSSNSATENSAAIARITASKALHVNLRTSAGAEVSLGTDYTNGAAQASPAGPAVMGYDGANVRAIATDASGNVQVEFGSSQTVAATQSGTWNVTNVSGTVSLPTGASTAANQSTAITALQLIDDDQTGATPSAVASAASTNSTNVKASAGRLLGMYLVNTTATVYYIRFYNLASAPTCSSATGFVFTMPIPAATTGAGFSMPFPQGGLAFSTGIGYCITGGATSTDNTSAATGIFGVLSYK
jgi:hypothetical protein